MLNRAFSSWFFTALSVIALACVSCSDTAQQVSSSQGKATQPPRITEGGRMPLTDSVPPQLDVTPTLVLTDSPISYEAEAPQNTLTGDAQAASCSECSGGYRVIHIGHGSSLQFNDVRKRNSGNYLLTVYYKDDKRTLYISVNGGIAKSFYMVSSSGSDIATFSPTIALNAGTNTVKFFNPVDSAPDIDRITV